MVKPKIIIDKEIGEEILRKASIKEKLKEVKEFYHGWNSILLLKTNKRVYSVRIFTSDFGFHGNEWKAQKEEYIYKKLNSNNIKAPKFFYHDKSKKIIPYDYILIEYLPGIQLSEIDGAVQKGKRRSPTLSKKAYAKILYEIGRRIAKIHSIKMPRLSIFDFPLDKNVEWKPLRSFEEYLKRCSDKKLKKKIEIYAKGVLEKLPKKPRLVPVHTEITSRNVLVKNKTNWKFSGIIDIEWFMKCLPEREFARQTHELLAYHRDKKLFRWRLRNLLKGYYENGGKLDYPETIPLMILHHLLWVSYTPKRFKENKWLFEINLSDAENIVKEYKNVISELE